MDLKSSGAFPCQILIFVALIVSPALSQTNGEFWWLQKNPVFAVEKGVSENLQDGNMETNSILTGNSQGDSDMNSESNENMNLNDEDGVLPSHSMAENLIHIPPSVSPLSIAQNPPLVSQGTEPSAPEASPNLASSAPQPEVAAGVELFQPPLDEIPNCTCVEYYLCGSDNRIITNGEGGLIDVRASDLGKCPGIQVCCELPDTDESPATVPVKPPVTRAPPPPSTCGIRGGDLDPTWFRILNDDDNSTVFGEFPWMLALLRAEDMGDGRMEYNLFQCGAALIHPQVAVTAAHCVASRKVRELKIRAGEWDTQTKTEALQHQERSVSQIIKHPDFYSGALYNDIALLILDSPLEIASNVLPVCLPEQDAVFDGSRCFATGWGVNAFRRGASYQTTLKKVELPIVPSADCQGKLRQTRLGSFFRLHDSFICAGGEIGKDTCKGDGGGPLVCQRPNSSTYVHVGIVSWGIGCGENGVPAVYTNVPHFRNWIDTILNNMKI